MLLKCNIYWSFFVTLDADCFLSESHFILKSDDFSWRKGASESVIANCSEVLIIFGRIRTNNPLQNAPQLLICDGAASVGCAPMLGLICAVRAVRPEGAVHVPSWAQRLSAGEGARLWLLLHLRARRESTVRCLHQHVCARTPLPAARWRGEATTCTSARQRTVHQREGLQGVASDCG